MSNAKQPPGFEQAPPVHTHETVNHSGEPEQNTQHYDSKQKSTPSVEATPPAVGETFAGFRLLSVLGEGGFGTVFRAEDIELRRKVALKVLHAHALSRPGAQDGFLGEARALAAVQHDNVVTIYQVGREREQLFLAMPLLGGETLAARIEREGALPAGEVRRIGREIAAGLSAIHAKGLVHRDLKPANIWLEAGTGRVKVLDLGLANDPLATGEVIAGTPQYMSPEQADGKELDYRSDLFSLGSVLYECASGRRAFGGTSTVDTLRSIREQQPTPVTRLNPAVPSDMSSLIEQLHQKHSSARPVSANEVARMLANSDYSALPPTVQLPGPPSASRRPWIIAIAGLVMLAAVAIVAWPKGTTSTESKLAPPRTSEPLRVKSLAVNHYSRIDKDNVKPEGAIGVHSFGATLDDEFDVQARLNREAYAYLIVFRPDGKDAVLYPQDDDEPPAKTDSPYYPSKRRDERYVMEEGAGLWLVALVASEKPLPSYRDWRAGMSSSPWNSNAGKPDRVWFDDGQFLETIDKGRAAVRGERASKSAADKAPIVRVVDWLRNGRDNAAGAVAFAVKSTKN